MTNFFESLMKYTRGILALSIVFLTFIFLFVLIFVEVPTNNKDILHLSIGFVLGGGIGIVVAYYFGTSKDKSDSDQSKIFPKDPPNP